jgi:1-acyl-sn-glycerol-3-phosphate acyltransferase
MLYHLLKILMTVALRFFYKHLHFAGLNHVPPKGPAIILANHHASLMDAALIGVVMKRPVYFFARGDVFVNSFVSRLLSWMHMLPVHNHEKGRKTLGYNKESFSTAQQVLLKGGIIVFFPESSSHPERQLLPFRKGAFRLAFQTAASTNFSFDIPIVPLGITYEHPTNSGTEVLIKASMPVSLNDYKEIYLGNPAAALLHICKETYERMLQLVVHINEARFFSLAETLLTINRNNKQLAGNAWYVRSDKQLEAEQEICRKVNDKSHALHLLNEKAVSYNNMLQEYQLKDETVSPFFSDNSSSKFLLIFLSPLYFVGCLLNRLPILIARTIVNKKVYRIDFYSWLYVSISAVLYLFWVLLLVIIVAVFFNWLYVAILLMGMALSAFFVIYYKKVWKKTNQQSKLLQLKPEQKQSLKTLRTEIGGFI